MTSKRNGIEKINDEENNGTLGNSSKSIRDNTMSDNRNWYRLDTHINIEIVVKRIIGNMRKVKVI